jgi:aspartyl-tRNA(Asn)/glutamyl-tRNA(Gln) amidotransferase subunit C
MEVNDALIDKLANLARLEFQPEEKARLKNDLQKMIAFVEKLQELDTAGSEPLLQMSTRTDVLREDVAKVTLTREEALKNAPETDGVFFKVPKVIERET